MATATSPTMFFLSSADISQNTPQPALQPVSLSRYRVVLRQTKALLSDGGFVFPSPTPAVTPLARVAPDFSIASIPEDNNLRHRTSSNDVFTCDQELDHTLILDDIRASDSGYDDDQSVGQNSLFTPSPTPIASDKTLSDLQKTSTFLRSVKARIKGRKISSSDMRSSASGTNVICFHQEEIQTHKTTGMCDQKERSLHEKQDVCSLLSCNNDVDNAPAVLESLTSHDNTGSSNVSRKGKRTTRSESVAGESASIKTPKTRSLSVSEVKSISPRAGGNGQDRQKNDRLTVLNTESGQTSHGDSEDLVSPKRGFSAPGGAHRSRSKFLTELYSGAEKIKRFINRGKMKKDIKMSPVIRVSQSSERDDRRSHSDEAFTSKQQNEINNQGNSSKKTDALVGNSPRKSIAVDKTTVGYGQSDNENRSVSNDNTVLLLPSETVDSCTHPHDLSTQGLSSDDENDVFDEQKHYQSVNTPRHPSAAVSIPKLKLQLEYSFQATLIRSKCEPNWKVEETKLVPNRRHLSLPATKPAVDHHVQLSTGQGQDTLGLLATSRRIMFPQRPSNGRLLSDAIVKQEVSDTVPADTRQGGDIVRQQLEPADTRQGGDNGGQQLEPADTRQGGDNGGQQLEPADTRQGGDNGGQQLEPAHTRQGGDNAGQQLEPSVKNSSEHTDKNATLQSQAETVSGNNCIPTLESSVVKHTVDTDDCIHDLRARESRPSDILTYSLQDGVGEMRVENDTLKATENNLPHTPKSVSGSGTETLLKPGGSVSDLYPMSAGATGDRSNSRSLGQEATLTNKLTTNDDVSESSRLRSTPDVQKRQLQNSPGARERQVKQQNPPPVNASDLDTSYPDEAGSAASCQSYSKYEDIKSLGQLQRLLSETQDPVERHEIRTVIRRLRYRPESVQLKHPADQLRSSTRLYPQTEKASPLSSNLQRSPELTPSAGPLLYSAGVQRTASTGAEFAHTEDISNNALFAGDRNLDNFDRHRDRKFTQHPVALTSVIVHNTKTSDESQITSSTTSASEDYVAYHSCGEPIRKSTNDTADIVRSLSNKDEDVSSVIEHVKARLKSRGESLTSESRRSTSVAPTSFDQGSLPPPSEQTSKVDYGSIIHSREERSSGDIIPISADPSPPRVLERSSENASEKYKEARDKILRASNIKILSAKASDNSVLKYLHITLASRQHLGSSPLLSVTQTPLAEQTSTGVATCVIPDTCAVHSARPDTLTDIQKLERGERPSKSKAYVSSLAWTFSPSVNQDKTSTHLKRSHSLNLKVVNCSPSDRSEERLPLHETLISDSQTLRGSGYTDTLSHENQLVHFDPSAARARTFASLTDPLTLQTTAVNNNQSSGCSEWKSNSDLAGTRSPDEPATMQSKIKSKIKRSKPLGRSLTESHIIRPQTYTSHLEIKMVPKSKDSTYYTSNLLNEPTQWTAGNIGDRFMMDSVQEQCDPTAVLTKRDTDNRRRFLSRSHVNLSHIDSHPPLTVHLVQKDLSNNAFKQSSTSETYVKVSPDDKCTPAPEHVQTETASSATQIHGSSVCSRQPKTTMEKAFSLLLEELDKMSSPEGHPSDLDLCHCEDWTTINSGSSNIKDTAGPQSPQPEPVYVSERSARLEDGILVSDYFSEQRLDLDPVNADQEGLVPITGAPTTQRCNHEVTLLVQARQDGLPAQENVRTQRTLSSPALPQPLYQSALSKPDPKSSSADRALIPQASFTLRAADEAVTRQECSSDGILHHVSKVTEDTTPKTSVNDYTTNDTIHCHDPNTTSGAQASKVDMDRDLVQAISTDNNVLLNHSCTTNMTDWDSTDGGINHSSITNTSARLRQPQANADKFLSTRTIDVSEDHDGTITVQAVAEDYNQNKVVTVRTKKLRTPSNANEELRDTIVERKKLSPGGAVLVERDVIQTKNRLTSRGSNYYSRSAYTLRSRREQGGAQTVEHSVCVENENKSVSQGHSWGDKAEAQVTLVDTSAAASVCQLPSSAADEIPSASEEDMRNHHFSQLDILPRTSRGEHSNGVPDIKATDGGSESAAGNCQVLPRFEKRLTDVSVTEGHSTILSCTVTEAVCVEWYQNGVHKRNSADFKQSYDGREARLQIGEVFLDDAGEYTCIAKNSAGEQRASCILHVIACDQETVVVPMFLTKLASKQIMEGGKFMLECDVIGSPEPSITWLKDGRQLASSLTYSSSYDGRVASLQIPAMRFQDAGCYMCVAENPAGKVSIDAIVTVQVKDQAPHFVARLENKSAVSGERIVLQCEITGSPLPFVCWRKDGRLVQTSSNCVQSFHGGVARLEIMQASPQDTACYECVATNPVSEMSCQCQVQVVQQKYQPEEITAHRDEQIIASHQRVSRHRIVKKLSEPRPADIIAAVIQRASSHGVQRAQSFTPGSSTTSRERFMVSHAVNDKSSNSHLHNAHSTVHQPQTLSVVRDTITIPPRSNIHTKFTDSSNISFQGKELSTNPDTQLEKPYGISRTPSMKMPESSPYTASTSLRVTNLGRSSSMNIGRSCDRLPSGHNMQSSGSVKSLWTSTSTDQLAPRETKIKSLSQELVGDLRPSSPIVGYRPVLPVFSAPHDKEKVAHSSSIKYLSSSGSSASNSHPETVLIEQVAEKERNYMPLSLTPSPLPLKRSYGSEITEPYNMSPAPLSTSVYSVTPSRLAQNSSTQDSPQLLQDTSQSKPQVPSVNVLRQHFLKNDQAATASMSNSSMRNPTGSAVRRWDSLPPQRSKPIVFQRTSAPGASRLPSMPAYDNITDEEELHKMMNATEDFEERKKIRARIREIRDKQREEMEAKRKQREAEAEDLVKKKFERAEEEKRKKMEAYKQQAPTHERDSKYHEVSQNLIQEKYKAAEEEKARKLAAYSSLAAKTGPAGSETTTTTSITTEKTPGGGVRTVTQKTSETKGFGGTSYGKPAEVTARELTEKLMRSSGPGITGHVTVRTEAWNSTNGLVEKSEKSHSWGAKPQAAKSAMAAFKQMDNTNNPDAGAAKPKAMVRSPNAIKQILLDWAKAMTQGYPDVEVTNFSTSWNNGMAFCALIHHFFPNAFDFSKLDPKQRRYNFTLAFDTAEKEADIAPLLDVEDMVKMKNPDWKCVFTYVQSIYRHLKDHENNKAGPIEQ